MDKLVVTYIMPREMAKVRRGCSEIALLIEAIPVLSQLEG